MSLFNFTLLAATTFVGLMAGLFYSYSCSVNVGLGKLPDAQYVAAMQSINRAIQNPVFFTSFFGSILFLPICTCLKYSIPLSSSFWLLITSALIYFIGSFGVTIFGNVPLNNTLESFSSATASKEEIHLHRIAFETKWNNLHFIRTVATIVSFILLLLVCIGNHNYNSAS